MALTLALADLTRAREKSKSSRRAVLSVLGRREKARPKVQSKLHQMRLHMEGLFNQTNLSFFIKWENKFKVQLLRKEIKRDGLLFCT